MIATQASEAVASAASGRSGDPLLLTPGPLTTSAATRAAMLHDRGSWDAAFNAITESRKLKRQACRLAAGESSISRVCTRAECR